MIKQAQKRAKALQLEHLVSFQIGDAYNLDFHDNTFDILLSVCFTVSRY